MISRICEVELYLTKKLITRRGTGYKPTEGDEDQGLRDELKRLRNELNGMNNNNKDNNKKKKKKKKKKNN